MLDEDDDPECEPIFFEPFNGYGDFQSKFESIDDTTDADRSCAGALLSMGSEYYHEAAIHETRNDETWQISSSNENWSSISFPASAVHGLNLMKSRPIPALKFGADLEFEFKKENLDDFGDVEPEIPMSNNVVDSEEFENYLALKCITPEKKTKSTRISPTVAATSSNNLDLACGLGRSSWSIRLYELLNVEVDQSEAPVFWSRCGDMIGVDPDNLQRLLLRSDFFKAKKVKAFVRRLNEFGFTRIPQSREMSRFIECRHVLWFNRQGISRDLSRVEFMKQCTSTRIRRPYEIVGTNQDNTESHI